MAQQILNDIALELVVGMWRDEAERLVDAVEDASFGAGQAYARGENPEADVGKAISELLAFITKGRCPECGHELVEYTNGDRHCECGYFDEDGTPGDGPEGRRG